MIALIAYLMLYGTLLPIPMHNHLRPDELAVIGVESKLVAVEGHGLEAGQTVDLDVHLTHGSTTFVFRVTTKYVTGGTRDVSHEIVLLRSSYEKAPPPGSRVSDGGAVLNGGYLSGAPEA